MARTTLWRWPRIPPSANLRTNRLMNPVFANDRIIGRAFTLTTARVIADAYLLSLNPNADAFPAILWNGIEVS